MLWTVTGRTKKVFLGLNGLSRASDAVLYEFAGESVSSAKVVVNGVSRFYGLENTVYTTPDFFAGDGIVSSVVSGVSCDMAVIRGTEASIATDSDMVGSAFQVMRNCAQSVQTKSNLLLYANVYLKLTDLSGTVLSVMLSTTYVTYVTTAGLYRFTKATMALFSWATLANTTCGTENDNGTYVGCASGVYRITEADLATAGDRTAYLTSKFTAGTTPSIQSNTVTCLSGSKAMLAVGSSAGLDFMPDSSASTVYRMTTAGVTRCGVKGLYIGYIVSGVAYVRGLPSANFSLSASDKSGVKPIVAYNRVTPSAIYETADIDLGGTNGSHVVQCGYGYSSVKVYRVENDYSLTLTQTLSLPTDFVNRGMTCYGDYLFVDCKNLVNTGAYLMVYKRSGDTYPTTIFAQANSNSMHNNSFTLNPQGTVFLSETVTAGTYTDGGSLYDVYRVHNRYTRSGDTVSGPTQMSYPHDFDVMCWTTDGVYLIGTGSLTGNGTEKILVFNNADEMPNIGGVANNYAVNLPQQILAYSATRIVTIEQGTASERPVYMCLYSISGMTMSFISKTKIGVNRIAATGEYFSYWMQMLNGYILMGMSTANNVGVYQATVVMFTYVVDNDVITVVGDGVELSTVDVPAAFTNVFTEGTRAITLVNDYDLGSHTSNGYRLNILDMTSDVASMYGTANDIKVEKDVFVATDVGILVEPQYNKLVKRVIHDELSDDNNVVTINPSPSAGRINGYVTYGTDDGTGLGVVGVVDLEA